MMINFKSIPVEVRSALIMGMTALLVTFIVSLLAGNSPVLIVGRTFTMTFIFAVIGLAAMIILKQFVPEVYNIFAGGIKTDTVPEEPEDAVLDSGMPDQKTGESTSEKYTTGAEQSSFAEGEESVEPEMTQPGSDAHDEVFTPLDKDDYPRAGSGQDTRSGQMGKHIILDDKKVKYEPKVMAEAIRTIMGRDKE
ncbi:MAG: hypothetical protein ACOCX9_01015 [Spirochaetota bacterium]